MPIRKYHKQPSVGSRYERTYKGKTYVLKVVERTGKWAYELSGKCFKTPSAAAKSVTKHEINGWDFWRID
jgi:hypothetical protein